MRPYILGSWVALACFTNATIHTTGTYHPWMIGFIVTMAYIYGFFDGCRWHRERRDP